MMRFMLAVLLTATSMVSLAGFVLADSQESTSNSYPVVAQLEVRNRKVTIKSAPNGYLYTITDPSGAILDTSLTEEQLAERYPELHDMLRPAVADEGAELIILAPILQ